MAAPESFASGLYTEILAASRGDRHAISRALFQKVMTISEVLADFLTCAAGVFAVCFLYPSLHIAREGWHVSWRRQPAPDSSDGARTSHSRAVPTPPAVMQLLAMLIWLDLPGPTLFVQKRVGRNGELFDMYNFRSMHTTAPRYDLSPTQSCDTRITAIGRFLRRTSLDELPQLINVFLGSMSLVGPRPEMPFIVRRYNSRQRQRLQVIPGITGLWQLSADRAFPIHENIQYDLSYIQNRTFFMDLAILIHTPFRALRGGV
jgi:lipopolysaccharide/colanic/teichoic acid biosynthesis glycosyltransferase